MLATVKMTAALSGVMIRDLPGYLNLARQRGLKAPAFDLEFLDGLSLKDANALRQALMQWRHEDPRVAAAWNDVSHPDYAALHSYQAMSEHFLAIHPRDASGALKAWDRPMSLGLQRALETGMDLPTDFLPAHEAEALRTYLTLRSDLTSAYHNKNDPLHDVVAREVEALAERAAAPPEPTVDSAAQQHGDQARQQVDQSSAAIAGAREQINALLKDTDFTKAYFSKSALGHAEAVARMAALHEALAGNVAIDMTAAGVAADPLAATQARIAEINSALRQYRIGAADKAILLDELHDLNASLPAGTRPAQAPTSNILPDTARPIGVVASGAVSRPAAIALTERLKTGGLRGQARVDALNALAAELAGGPAGPRDGDQAA